MIKEKIPSIRHNSANIAENGTAPVNVRRNPKGGITQHEIITGNRNLPLNIRKVDNDKKNIVLKPITTGTISP